MSIIAGCQKLTKAYHGRPLFAGLDFEVHQGDRIGVIGPNGAGKSTLLRLLAGREEADQGEVTMRRGTRLAYVEQAPTFAESATALSTVAHAAAELGVPSDACEYKAETTLSRLKFPDPEQKVSAMSGGWRKRLAIACALVGEPDIVLLDEPTNHLDLDGILWLEKVLANAPFAWVMITHDRYFLDKIATKITEIARVYPGGAFTIKGTYGDFLVARTDYLAGEARLEETLANKARREIEWLRRGPKARTTKQQARIDEANSLIGELAEVRSRQSTGETKIDFSASGRKTKRLVVADDVRLNMGDRDLLKGFDFVLTPGLAVALTGGNGSGKTTLLKVLAKLTEPAGGRVAQAEGLKVVYFDQERAALDPMRTLKDTLAEGNDAVVFRGRSIHIASWAKRFQFAHEHLNVRVGELSGGEQARAVIARLMLQPADVLLLDEPTNDLDIPTLEALEESLSDFPGAIVVVSHDRYFVDKLASLVIGLDGRGGYGVFADREQSEKALAASAKQAGKGGNSASSAASSKAGSSGPTSSKRLSYNEQREYDQMEAKILVAEGALEAAKTALEAPGVATSAGRLAELTKALETCEKDIERLYTRWTELAAKLA